jgi:hypothetical protein
VQPPPSIAKGAWHEAMCAVAWAKYGARWETFDPDPPLSERAQELARRKYSQPAYNRKR